MSLQLRQHAYCVKFVVKSVNSHILLLCSLCVVFIVSCGLCLTLILALTKHRSISYCFWCNFCGDMRLKMLSFSVAKHCFIRLIFLACSCQELLLTSHHIETTDAGLDGLCIREINVYHTNL